jgi:hypothetical protein
MVVKGMDVIIIVLAVFNIEILKAISCGPIRVEVTQVFCLNLPRRFLKV